MPLHAASGALRIYRQMCNNSYVAVMSVLGRCGQSLKNTLGMQGGRDTVSGTCRCSGKGKCTLMHRKKTKNLDIKMKQMSVFRDKSHFLCVKARPSLPSSQEHMCNRTKM